LRRATKLEAQQHQRRDGEIDGVEISFSPPGKTTRIAQSTECAVQIDFSDCSRLPMAPLLPAPGTTARPAGNYPKAKRFIVRPEGAFSHSLDPKLP
jgi:hypothetical protein